MASTTTTTVVTITLSARARGTLSLTERANGEIEISACDAHDAAAAHICTGDIVLEIDGQPPDAANLDIDGDGVLILKLRRELSAAPTPPLALESNDHSLYGGAFGSYGLGPADFSMPCNMLLLHSSNVVVADGGGCRLQIFTEDGRLLRLLTSGRGEGPGQLNYPAGLATDGEALFVADRGNCRLQKLRLADGAPLASSETAESGCAPQPVADEQRPSGEHTAVEEMLNYPWGIALAGGLLYASDMRGRLYVFDAASLELLCCLTATALGLTSPHAMTIAADELFVADYDRHRVLVLALRPAAAGNGEGTTTAPAAGGGSSTADRFFTGSERCIGRQGSEPGQFENPVGVAASNGRLFVSEFTGRRLQALTLAGEPLYILAPPSITRLLGLCVTANRVYAGDFDGDCVHWWWRPESPEGRRISDEDVRMF